jgi:hypothetical protein
MFSLYACLRLCARHQVAATVTFTVTNIGLQDWCADIVAQESQVVLMPGFDDPLVAAHL